MDYYFEIADKTKVPEQTFDINAVLEKGAGELAWKLNEPTDATTFAKQFGIELVHTDYDANGKEFALLRIKDFKLINQAALNDPYAYEYITYIQLYFLRVICPSTAKVHFIVVPPNVRTARGAMAWTFGKNEATFYPAIET